MRILHVEDDQDTRTLVAFILQDEGWEVVSVEKASPALELAAAGGFDLYLLDNWIDGNTDNALCRALCSFDPPRKRRLSNRKSGRLRKQCCWKTAVNRNSSGAQIGIHPRNK